MTLAPREVTLVLCTPDGRVLGALAPFAVDSPWWPDVGDVAAGARTTYGIDVVVLRLLRTGTTTPAGGGPVTYLAQVSRPPRIPIRPWRGDPTADQPQRAPWARPGGPDDLLAWADETLAGLGLPRCGPPEQVRAWNLSTLWRLPTAGGRVWLKCVPEFFAHEAALISVLDTAVVPPLIAWSGSRMLLAHVPGDDQYGAPLGRLLPMVGLLVGLQVAWTARLEELLAIGLPDWRAEPLTALAADVVGRTAVQLDGATLATLQALLERLPERWADIDSCGIPATVVHGDFHPGNVRGDDHRLVLLDWGDSGVGHPLLDQAAFTERLTVVDRVAVRSEWRRLWEAAVPGCDPDRAADLLAPLAALRQAVIYRRFLDRIEESEHVFHRDDPALWLRRAAELGC